jgi:hypothetical protein
LASSPLTTIGAALGSAAADDEVRIGPGTYTEQIIIDTPVALRGGYDASFDTTSGTNVFVDTVPALSIASSLGPGDVVVVENFVFQPQNTGTPWILVEGGDVTLRNLDVTAQGPGNVTTVAIEITGGTANVLLDDSEVSFGSPWSSGTSVAVSADAGSLRITDTDLTTQGSLTDGGSGIGIDVNATGSVTVLNTGVRVEHTDDAIGLRVGSAQTLIVAHTAFEVLRGSVLNSAARAITIGPSKTDAYLVNNTINLVDGVAAGSSMSTGISAEGLGAGSDVARVTLVNTILYSEALTCIEMSGDAEPVTLDSNVIAGCANLYTHVDMVDPAVEICGGDLGTTACAVTTGVGTANVTVASYDDLALGDYNATPRLKLNESSPAFLISGGADTEALCQDWGLAECSIFTRDRAGCVHSCTTPGTDCYPVGANALYRYDAVAGRWVCGPP